MAATRLMPLMSWCHRCRATASRITRTQRGMHVLKVADLWAKLMTEGLGYQRFGAQGGDWGASVTYYLGLRIPTTS